MVATCAGIALGVSGVASCTSTAKDAPESCEALPPAAAAALLSQAWGAEAPAALDQGTIVLDSRMSAWYAADTWARGPSPWIVAAMAASTQRDAATAWVASVACLSYSFEAHDGLWAGPPLPVPDELGDAVAGEILLAEHMEGVGWVVVGGMGPNGYDLGRVAAVFDCGGDDAYAWLDTGGAPPKWQAVIDLSGDDTYRDLRVDASVAPTPPGATCVIDDHGGDDTYDVRAIDPMIPWPGLALVIDRAGTARVSVGGGPSAGAPVGLAMVMVGGAGALSFVVDSAEVAMRDRAFPIVMAREGDRWRLVPQAPPCPFAP